MSKPVVAIVGRPNVGKSTLFNRIVGGRVAIVESQPGITRDRLYRDAEWNGCRFTLVDTGGLDFGEQDGMAVLVRRQAEVAIEEADLVLFVTDSRAGVTATDVEVAEVLRRSGKPVLLVANKVEKFSNRPDYFEFYNLGLGEPIPVSAAEGLNIGDLLDKVVELLPISEQEAGPEDAVRVAIIGRPNVGKSSLLNAIIGEDRVIVSSVPGTTRDAVDTVFTRKGKHYLLVDTAGIRRKSRIVQSAEYYSVNRSFRAVDRCDVVLMLIEAPEGVTEQDKRIAGYAHEKGKACVLVVNKWDLVEKNDRVASRYMDEIRQELAFLHYAPVVFTSTLTGRNVGRVLELVDHVFEQYSQRVPTAVLNAVIRDAVLRTPLPSHKGRQVKIFYAVQVGVKPPTFVLFVSEPDLVHFSYLRYVENRLRSAFGFEGTPLRLVLRKRGR